MECKWCGVLTADPVRVTLFVGREAVDTAYLLVDEVVCGVTCAKLLVKEVLN